MVVVDESAAVAVAVRSESVGNAESEAAVADATSDESCLLSFFCISTSISQARRIQGENEDRPRAKCRFSWAPQLLNQQEPPAKE